MNDLNKLRTEELVDILSKQTSLYVQMHIEGAWEKEFQKFRLLLQAVQAEISSRRESKSKQDQ